MIFTRTSVDGLWKMRWAPWPVEDRVEMWLDMLNVNFERRHRYHPNVDPGYHQDWHIDRWHEPTHILPAIIAVSHGPGTIFRGNGVVLETHSGEAYLTSGLVEHKSPECNLRDRIVYRWFLYRGTIAPILELLP